MVATKRKQASDSDESTAGAAATKMSKRPNTTTTKIIEQIPTNKTMPTDYSFMEKDPAPKNCIKLVSYNVNSLQASCKKGFKEYFKAENPDLICVQETKANQPLAFLVSKKDYPHQYWHCSKTKKGYAGTAVFSKLKPLAVSYGINDPDKMDTEGRTITLEFEDFHFVGCYVPNAGDKLVRLDRRQKWDKRMNEYLTGLEATKPVVYAGDLNVAHHPVDLARPDSNKRSPGFTQEERDGFTDILKGAGSPRIDVFRRLYPDARASGYTYFGYRANCRANSVGWRLDYFVVSSSIMPRVKEFVVRNQCYGASDHVPIVLYLEKGKQSEDKAGEASDGGAASGGDSE